MRKQLNSQRIAINLDGIDIEAVRDRVLATLKLGKQAPKYKASKVVLDKFIEDLGKVTATLRDPSPPT
ncbi:MAG: hypothetical protein SAK29_29070, partial [Scytonema sp. PMC 1069.18]|nr:hypothetical protein [Scytonema sp. PMC 1069.18]